MAATAVAAGDLRMLSDVIGQDTAAAAWREPSLPRTSRYGEVQRRFRQQRQLDASFYR